MKKIKNSLATDINEKLTLREYAAYASSSAVSRVGGAMNGFFGALVASTFLGLSEAAFATYSTIIFFLGFWDIANDVIVSSFLDKSRKSFGSWGRFKPWIMIMIIPFNLVVIMQAFPLKEYFPGVSDTFKVTYLVLLYFLNDAFSTFYNSALTALNARRTTNNMERGYIAAIDSILGSAIGSIGTYIAALLPFLLPNLSDAERYFYGYSVVTIAAIPLTIWNIIETKERINDPPKEETPKLRDVYRNILRNKPLILYMVSEILSLGFGIGYSLMTYAFIACFRAETFTLTLFEGTALEFTYVYNDGNYAALLSVASLASFVTTGISLFAAPIVRRWVDDKILYIGMRLGTFVCYIAMFLSIYPYEEHEPQEIFVRVVFWYALHGLTTGFYNTISGLIQMAVYDYGEYEFGERNEATVSALKGTLSRIITNCTTYVTNLLLIYVGYTQFADTPELMPMEAKKGLLYSFSLFPGVSALLAVIPMFFFKLTGKKHKEIVKFLEERRQQSLDEINKTEAEATAKAE
ncbi:MAG: MFS transporter [Clostridia bacterium]|nr:MFS transporter [Clostridia bacterium]